MGSSPHAWINAIAIYFKLFGTSLDFMPYFSWVWTCAAFFCLRQLLIERFTRTLSTLFAFLLITVFLLPSAAGLMETPMASFFFLLSLTFLKNKKIFWFGFFAGVCLWVRVEFLALICLGPFFVSREQRGAYLGAASIPIAIYLIYTLYYFGTPVPLPVISKPIVYSVGFAEFFSWLPDAVSYPMDWRYFWFPLLRAWTAGPALLGLYAWLFYFALRHKATPWMTLCLCFSGAVLLTYFIKHTFIFSWYVPLFSLPLALTFVLLVPRKNLVLASFLILIGLFNVFYIATTNLFASISNKDYYFDEYASGWRVQQFLQIGTDLYEKKPDATLLTAEIGALGWTFKGKIMDGAALISPDALKYHPMNVPNDRPWTAAGAIPYQFVLDTNPDFIVSLPIFSVAVRREIESGLLKYKLLYSKPVIPVKEYLRSQIFSVWSSRQIDVFARK